MTALHKFTRDAWPLIVAEMPGVELLVGGNFDLKAQAEFAHIKNMRFTGRVDDMRPAFDQSDVFVAPFEDTHGSKLKIAEAMAMAMPIVSTVQGIRGFPLVDGQSVLIAQDDAQFARHVIDLLDNALMRRKLGLAARGVAEKCLCWSQLGQRLEKIIAEVQKEIA
jgi:glycosyltransferase involved in cell wall biosynthesis